MIVSGFFINRPIFATVISIVIVLAGLASISGLPVEQYPNIVPPQVQVTATYPGASAETVADTVIAPLEQQINGVENMIYMVSTSAATGAATIDVTFEVGTDPDKATIDVNNRVKQAEVRLPSAVRQLGISVVKSSSNILQVVTMSSTTDRYDSVFVSNYALLNVIDDLKRVPGVGNAMLFGQKDYSMRIWLYPDKLAQHNLTPADVEAAVQSQNNAFAGGQFGSEPMVKKQAYTYNVMTTGRLTTPEEFGNIILRSAKDGAALHLKDVARIELGAQDYSFHATYNAKPAVPIGIFLQPGANAVEVSKAVADKMKELATRFPEGITYALPFNTTKFVEISIHEVVKTFIEAILLVTLVMYLFLQNARATIIPVIAVPVSIIGTLAGLYILGFSVNLLTLFALVLAIGIVVDDAIIVIENVERLMTTEGKSPREASFEAMREVTSPIIAIVLVLTSVFLPVAFLGGMTGEMYRQFAVTISIAVVISGFVALTLTPALCVFILKPSHNRESLLFRMFNKGFGGLTTAYAHGIRFFLNHMVVGILLCVAMAGVTVMLFKMVPGGLVPEEDQGYLIMAYQLPPAASVSRTEAVTSVVSKRVSEQPEVESIVTFAGFDILSGGPKTNGGVSFILLDDWDQRKKPEQDSRAIAGRFFGLGMDIKDGMSFAFNPPPIMGMSMTGGFEGYLQNRAGASYADLEAQTNKLLAAASQNPMLRGVRTTFSNSTPQYFIDLDKEKAMALGVPLEQIYATMQATFGSSYINDFNLYGRSFRVTLQSDAAFRESPENLRSVYVRSDSGSLIPLASLITIKTVTGPDQVDRFNSFPAAKITGEPAPGYSSGQALAAMEELAKKTLPDGYNLEWMGSSYQEKMSAGSGQMGFIFGIVMIMLILAAQYERWTIPLAVVTAVPFAVFGGVLAIWLRGLNNDLYFQIGLITLIGLSAKNAILIVEFALMKVREGLSLTDAAVEAARLRFRPIIMTSLAFMMGCIPLAISSGAGAGSRHAIGTGVIGGMLAATFIATLFIPMFFKLVAMFSIKVKPIEAKNSPEIH